LKAVLDRSLSGDLAELSNNSEGDLQDGLPVSRERIGSIQTASGTLDIEVERIERDGSHLWLFSAATLQRIPGVHEAVDTPAVTRSLPGFLTESRFLSRPLWKWLAALLGLISAFALASLITRAVIPLLLQPVLRRLTGTEDERRLASLRGPVRLLVLSAAIRILASFWPTLLTRQNWTNVAMLLGVIGFAWLAIQFADIVSELNARRLAKLHKTEKIAMEALARRLLKVLVVFIAVLLLLHRAGVNVTAMLAGLGVGGIALALAAQKTLENVFGGIHLIMREAIRVGDTCRIGSQLGIVQDIGLGSTQFRTLDRTIVSVPNAQLSQVHLENFSMRDKFWFHQIFGLRYDTSAQQMREILAGIDNLLRTDDTIEAQTARVRFIGFGTSSQTLEISAYIVEQNDAGFLRCQERLLLGVLDVIAGAGACIASPLVVTESISKASTASA
jgi:MscS family membrane protein